MGTTSPSKYDFVIIGSGTNALLLAMLLTKKNYSIAVVGDKTTDSNVLDEEYSVVPLSFLRIHSIPYSEISFKNKSTTAFIERFCNLEKFVFQRKTGPTNWIARSSKQLGIVNHKIFHRFVTTLITKESQVTFLNIGEQVSIAKATETPDTNNYELKIQSERYTVPATKIIITNPSLASVLEVNYFSVADKGFKYVLKTNEIFSDAITHYFVMFNNEKTQVSILPCSTFSIIEFNTQEPLENPISEELLSFLEKNFDEQVQDLELIRTDTTFKTISIMEMNGMNLIPNRFMVPFPFISNLFFSLVAIFSFSHSLEPDRTIIYSDWFKQWVENYAKLNNFLLASNDDENIHDFGSLIHGKDVVYINSISKMLVKLKFTKMFKNQNLTTKDFQYFIEILNQSYSI